MKYTNNLSCITNLHCFLFIHLGYAFYLFQREYQNCVNLSGVKTMQCKPCRGSVREEPSSKAFKLDSINSHQVACGSEITCAISQFWEAVTKYVIMLLTSTNEAQKTKI